MTQAEADIIEDILIWLSFLLMGGLAGTAAGWAVGYPWSGLLTGVIIGCVAILRDMTIRS